MSLFQRIRYAGQGTTQRRTLFFFFFARSAKSTSVLSQQSFSFHLLLTEWVACSLKSHGHLFTHIVWSLRFVIKKKKTGAERWNQRVFASYCRSLRNKKYDFVGKPKRSNHRKSRHMHRTFLNILAKHVAWSRFSDISHTLSHTQTGWKKKSAKRPRIKKNGT